MKLWRDQVSWLLLAFSIGCFTLAAFPQWNEWVDPQNRDKVSERRHGFWFSPVYLHIRREPAEGGFTAREEIHWLSWSSVVILVGFANWELLRWRRKRVAID